MELTGKSINFMFPGIETLQSGSKSNWVSSIWGIFYLWGTFFCKKATWLAGSGPGYIV
jgi:hypothetical protein